MFELDDAELVGVVFTYQGTDGNWHNEAHWGFAPGQSSVLNAADGRPLSARGNTWYSYARSMDGSELEWAGDHMIDWGGEALAMDAWHDAEGDKEWYATCD